MVYNLQKIFTNFFVKFKMFMEHALTQFILFMIQINISCNLQLKFIYNIKVKQGGWTKWKYWKWFKLFKLFHYGYVSILFVRMGILSVWLKNGYSPEWIIEWDPFFGSLIILYKFVDFYTTLAFMPLILFMIGFDFILFFSIEKNVVILLYEFIIVNQNDFIQSNVNINRSLNMQFFDGVKNFPSIEILWMVWKCKKSGDQIKFKKKQTIFPFLSNRIRTRMLILSCLFETTANFLLSFACKYLNYFSISNDLFLLLVLMFGFYFSMVILKNWTILQFHLRLIIICDSLMMAYFIFNVIRIAIIFVFAIMSLYISLGSHLSELNIKLFKFIQSCNAKANTNHIEYVSSLYRLIDTLFAQFISQYEFIFLIINRLNNNLVSKVMLVTILCNFPINLYSVTLLAVRKNLLPEELGYLISVIIMQFLLISIGCLVLIKFSENFYLFNQNIFRLASFPNIPFQCILFKSIHHIRGKIRLALFYEKINTNTPFQFKVGWIGLISKQTVSQFFIFYITNLLLSLNFVKK